LAGRDVDGSSERLPELTDATTTRLDSLGDAVQLTRRLTAEITLLVNLVCQVRRLRRQRSQTISTASINRGMHEALKLT